MPASPLLVAGIDHSEPGSSTTLRGIVVDYLSTRSHWYLPVTELPPVLGLGGYGIDEGIDTSTGAVLTGQDWRTAVACHRSPADRLLTACAPIALLAAQTGCTLSALTATTPATAGVLIPIDASAAAHAHAPLAPIPGAGAFDAQLGAALHDWDTQRLATLCAEASSVHADLSALARMIPHMVGTPMTTKLHTATRAHVQHLVCALWERA